MDISSTKNGILQCVRCESKDNIKQYHHKTPVKQDIKSTKYFTKITTYPGTGGSGYVPVCSQCIRKFTLWKVLFPLFLILLIISFFVFSIILIFTVAPLPDVVMPTQIQKEISSFLTLSGIIVLILFISVMVMKWSLSINPHNVIKINTRYIKTKSHNIILIKPKKSSSWMPIESFMPLTFLKKDITPKKKRKKPYKEKKRKPKNWEKEYKKRGFA